MRVHDNQIIRLFNERSEQAIIELSKKYGYKCRQVALNILQNECDAEECVNEAYFVLWNHIPPSAPDPLITYLLKIVRNLALKRKRENSFLKRNDKSNVEFDEVEEILTDERSTENAFDAKELEKLIDRFLDTLDKDSRIMFLRRYWFCDSVEGIAKALGKSSHFVSVKLSRTKEKLKKYLEKEGYEI